MFFLCFRLYVAMKVVLRLMFVILNNIYCIPTYCVWMLMLLPLRKLYPSLYWKMEGLFFKWLLAMVTMWSWTAGYDRKFHRQIDIRNRKFDRRTYLIGFDRCQHRLPPPHPPRHDAILRAISRCKSRCRIYNNIQETKFDSSTNIRLRRFANL